MGLKNPKFSLRVCLCNESEIEISWGKEEAGGCVSVGDKKGLEANTMTNVFINY